MKLLSPIILHVLVACALLAIAPSFYAEGTIATTSWDNRDGILLNGVARISPTATGENTGTLLVDGTAPADWTAETPLIDTAALADGWHTMSLTGAETGNANVLLLNDSQYVIHEGVLEDDEVWEAGVIHIVRNWVRIPAGKRLVIANGAVVKFCEDTGIQNNGTLSAISASLTALEDDTIGGDSEQNGNETDPAAGTYAIENNGTLTAIDCNLFYATNDSVFETTTIADGAFSGCAEITRAVIPANVTNVGANAFSGCTNLQEVTFEGKTTEVDDTAFDNCGRVKKVNFTNGLPDLTYVFGNSNPTIYLSTSSVPATWSGYSVMDSYSRDILGRTLPAPEEEGEPGQVLTKTEDGVEWQDAHLTIDDALDAESENAVQNKVVTAAIEELQTVDATIQEDITALQTQDAELLAADATMQEDIETLQEQDANLLAADTAMQGDIASLQSKDAELEAANATTQNSIGALQGNLNALQGADSLMQTDIAALQAKDTQLASTDNTLRSDLNSLRSTSNATAQSIETLRAKDNELQSAINAIRQEAGSNLEARVAALEASNTALETANRELTEKLNALLGVLEGSGQEQQVLTKGADGSYAWQDASAMGAEVLSIRLEEGWNLVAMPGRVIFDDSEEAVISQIEIYTYDRSQQIYIKSQGLEPLTSYWMRAPNACTIHFEVVAPAKD